VITDDVPSDKLAFGRARQVVRDHTDTTRKFSDKKKGS
jgi:bifunctional N-acetylglucosamine-1-phosphate-uridyltransferase/glucosamine-1-phosphate-acetyltransferase GlmU-like protein